MAEASIRATIFDLDGVLVQSERIAWKTWRDFLVLYGKELHKDDYRHLIGTASSAAVIREFTDIPMSADEIMIDHRRRIMDLLDTDLIVTAGAGKLLEELKRRGYLLGVASNSVGIYVDRVLQIAGMRAFFDCVVSRDDVAQGKPAPDIYLEAARKLKVPPKRCLAIEDSPIGLQAAIAADMRCVAIPNPDLDGFEFPGAYAQFDTIAEFHTDLDRLLEN